MRISRLNNVVVAVTALLAVFVVACGTANAQSKPLMKPFKMTGVGLAEFIPLPPPPGDPIGEANMADHFAVGTATHLGEYFGEGTEQTEMFTGPLEAQFSSAVPFVFTGANGDDLAFHYGRVDFGAAVPGSVELYPQDDGTFIAVFFAEFTPVFELCTGRFEKVIGGSFFMVAITEPFVLGTFEPPVVISWEGEGALEWARR